MSQIFDFSALVSGDDCKNFFNAALSEFKKMSLDYLLEDNRFDVVFNTRQKCETVLNFLKTVLGENSSAIIDDCRREALEVYKDAFLNFTSTANECFFKAGKYTYKNADAFKKQLELKGFLKHFNL